MTIFSKQNFVLAVIITITSNHTCPFDVTHSNQYVLRQTATAVPTAPTTIQNSYWNTAAKINSYLSMTLGTTLKIAISGINAYAAYYCCRKLKVNPSKSSAIALGVGASTYLLASCGIWILL